MDLERLDVRSMRMSRRAFLGGATSLAAVSLLAACAPSAPAPAKPAESKPAEGAKPTAAPAAKTEPKPVEAAKPAEASKPTAAPAAKTEAKPADPRMETLTIGVTVDPGSFDPQVNTTIVGAYRFFPNVYETLIRYAPDGSLQPALAESWTTSDQGRTYRFKLRSGVKFSDGAPFNAQAVEASFNRMRTLNKGAVSLFAPIDSIKVLDETSFDLVMKQPYAPILAALAGWQGAIFVSPTAAKQNEKDGDWGQAWLMDHTVGTGPYMLESWERNSRVVLVRNPNYREQLPAEAPRRVVYALIAEPGTLRQQLAAGDVDLAEEITPSLVEPLKGVRGLEVKIDTLLGSTFGQPMCFNLTKQPFDDVNFRRAVAHAVDYKRIVQVWNGVATQAQGPFPESFKPWFSAQHAVQYQQNLDKAAEALKAGGYSMPLNPRMKFQLIWQQGQTAQRDTGQLLVEDLAKIGIDIDLVGVELPVWREAIWKHTFELAFAQSSLRYIDPDAYARLYALSTEWRDGGFNPGIRDPKMDELINAASETTDEAQRRSYYNEFQKRMTEDVMLLYLVNRQQAWAHGTNISGITWNPNYGPCFDIKAIRKTGPRQR